MRGQVTPTRLAQQPVTGSALPGDQRLGPGMADQQQHPRSLLPGLGQLDVGMQRIEPLAVVRCKHGRLLLCTEQLPQVPEVFIHCRQLGLAGEQLDPHAGLADLRQYRWRPHLLGAHQHIRAQAENAFGRQLPLVANAGQ
ncbi:hypothetical protein D3C71_1831480 [compost metagenome]